MKKLIFSTVIVAASLFTANLAAAATIGFNTSSLNVKAGDSFSVVVKVDPAGVKNYTVKTELLFPADILSFKSFAPSSGWMALNQPGYDGVDATAGVVIKTGGYAGGMDSPKDFGTFTFVAKKAGNVFIKIGNNSLVLNAQGTNTISATGSQVRINVTKTVLGATTPKTVVTSPVTTAPATVTPGTGFAAPLKTVPAEANVAQIPPGSLLLAQISRVVTLGSGNNLIGFLFLSLYFLSLFLIAIPVGIQRARRKDFWKLQ